MREPGNMKMSVENAVKNILATSSEETAAFAVRDAIECLERVKNTLQKRSDSSTRYATDMRPGNCQPKLRARR